MKNTVRMKWLRVSFALMLGVLLVGGGRAHANIPNVPLKAQVSGGRIVFTSTRSGSFTVSNSATMDGVVLQRKIQVQTSGAGKTDFTISESSTRGMKKYVCKNSVDLDFMMVDKKTNESIRFTQSFADALYVEVGEPSEEMMEEARALETATTAAKKVAAKAANAKKDEDAKKDADTKKAEAEKEKQAAAAAQASKKRNIRTYKANSIWELVLIISGQDMQQFAAMLSYLQKDLSLEEYRKKITVALLDVVDSGNVTNMANIETLVAQLADPDFAVRESASRQLRKMGGETLVLLISLDWDALEPEQVYRLKQIRDQLETGSEHEDIQLYAKSLTHHAQVWVGVLESKDPAQRAAAVRQLETFLGEKIAFQPDISPQEQQETLQELRKKAGGK